MDNTGFTEGLFGIDVVPDGETEATHVSSMVVAPELSLTVNDATKRATVGLSVVSGRPRQLPNVRACAIGALSDYGVAGTPAVDGVAISDGERVLFPYQPVASERGIYRRSGSLYVKDVDVINGTGHTVFVESGARFGGTLFVLRAANVWREFRGPDYYAAVPIIGQPIEVWDADSGIETDGVYITRWVGLNGTSACPISRTQAIETSFFSGGRNAVSFNGTSDGMRAWLGALRRTNDHVSIYLQLVSNGNDSTWKQLCELSIDGAATTKRLEILHPATINYLQCGGGTDSNTLTVTSGWAQGTELVIGAARAADTRLELFRNGVSIGSQGDTTSGMPSTASDLIIGHSAFASNGAFFNGWVRRVAVYNVAHDDTEAAAIDAAWRGY
jgi:hypothetical protein